MPKKLDGYTYGYMKDTAEIAGIMLPDTKQDYEDFVEPKVKRQVNRLCWLRQTGLQIKRVDMTEGTGVDTVDKEIDQHFKHDETTFEKGKAVNSLDLRRL